jgi:hypothetical protein
MLQPRDFRSVALAAQEEVTPFFRAGGGCARCLFLTQKTEFDRDGLSALSAVPEVCKDDQGAARVVWDCARRRAGCGLPVTAEQVGMRWERAWRCRREFDSFPKGAAVSLSDMAAVCDCGCSLHSGYCSAEAAKGVRKCQGSSRRSNRTTAVCSTRATAIRCTGSAAGTPLANPRSTCTGDPVRAARQVSGGSSTPTSTASCCLINVGLQHQYHCPSHRRH